MVISNTWEGKTGDERSNQWLFQTHEAENKA
ncbi:hypothetical protein BN1058_01874 [Paraliobacillus sp. PM-2]|nr:hypothetical protein BN1058_01874 [Paraliobacillus sp. PM-2]